MESDHRALYYINKGRTVFLVAEPPSYISVVDIITIVLSDIVGSPSPLPLGSLFLCPEDSESAVTDILRICSENRGRETMRNNNNLIGKDILAQDAYQVQFHPLRPFYMGEIVAWRSQNGEKLKYGRIPEDVRPSAGQALYRFGVEIAPGVMETLLSSQVFCFRSVTLDDEGSSAMLSGVNDTVSENTMHAQVSEESRRQKIVSTQDKAETAAKEADTAKVAWQCRICLGAEVDVALVPCGHVLCRRCCSAVSKCPFCRLQVSKTMRIFRP
ncbi:Death-associated inhibitor of apoptosis 1 [Bienertia sinuspersici]